MNSIPKISVIIPVYNTEKYLHRCVESVLRQTMQDFELILVNDGSADRSGEICHCFADNDSRISAIDIANSGPARARNVGIDNAKGDYITFIDSDDYVNADFLEKLYAVALKNDADIVMCRICNTDGQNKIINQLPVPANTILEGKDVDKYILPCFFSPGKGSGLSSMCNKLIRLSWLKSAGVRINENRVRAEDWLFNIQCLLHNPRFIAIDEALYNYYQHPGSVMGTLRKGEWWQPFESMEILLDINHKIGGNYQEDIAITAYLSAAEFAIRLSQEGRYEDCTALIRSDKMENTVRQISFSSMLRQSRAFAAIGVLLKSGLSGCALSLIKHL